MKEQDLVRLPQPKLEGEISFERATKLRRSERDFKDQPLTMAQLSQILWSAQGITEERVGARAVPSAGACYPLDVYVVVGENRVEGQKAGIYHYHPQGHSMRILVEGDFRTALARACLRQMFMADAPVSIVITAEYNRITAAYGQRGNRYTHMEVGHVGQNIYLQAEALGLGTVAIDAFYDDEVSEVLRLPKEHQPLYIMPIGYHY